MRHEKRKWAVCFIAAALLLSGCETSAPLTPEQTDASVYPMEPGKTLSIYYATDDAIQSHSASLNETPFHDALARETGVSVRYVSAPVGQEYNGLMLMIASNDMTDIIDYNWQSYPGGLMKAAKDGLVADLTPYLEEYAPNLKRLFAENPDVHKAVSTVDGQICMFPFVRLDPVLTTYRGGMIRKDLLDKAGVAVPETISEWETALRALKQAGVDSPLTLKLTMNGLENYCPFIGAFNTCGEFYVENNQVKYGPYEDGFRDFVQLMARWYKEGLLDKNFADQQPDSVTQNLIEGKLGAVFGTAGGQLGEWNLALKAVNPEASLAPVRYPVLIKGQHPKFGQKNNTTTGKGLAITQNCLDKETAARFLDYGYGDEGHMLYNFGIQGISYTMENGYPTYTPNITDSSLNGGRSMQQMLSMYQRAYTDGPFVQDPRYLEQYFQLPEQKQALELWQDTDMALYKLPMLAYTDEESTELMTLEHNITAYVNEALYRFVVGIEPLENFDKYYETLNQFGIQRALEINQTAYERYLNAG